MRFAVCRNLCLHPFSQKFFDEEFRHEQEVSDHPALAFEKDFLRYMLSDGATALYLKDEPEDRSTNLEIEFIHMKSFANRQPGLYVYVVGSPS